MATQKHVIIAGFGRSGQNLATIAGRGEASPTYALDLDPDRVREAQAAGASVSYGDAARRRAWWRPASHRASAVVITYADTPSALKVLHLVHEQAPKLPVIVRSHDDTDLDELRAAGATEVVPEAIEGSLMLAIARAGAGGRADAARGAPRAGGARRALRLAARLFPRRRRRGGRCRAHVCAPAFGDAGRGRQAIGKSLMMLETVGFRRGGDDDAARQKPHRGDAGSGAARRTTSWCCAAPPKQWRGPRNAC